jgi:hypothetical protein
VAAARSMSVGSVHRLCLAFGVVDIGYNAMIPVLLFRVRLFGFCRIPRYLGDAISMLSITYQDFTHMTHALYQREKINLSFKSTPSYYKRVY